MPRYFALENALLKFDADHSLAAAREGWQLCTCYGSQYGDVQIQRFDCPEDWKDGLGFVPPALSSDDDAKRIVIRGAGAHYAAARALLQQFNPAELAYAQQLED